jgi:hypothetical protein
MAANKSTPLPAPECAASPPVLDPDPAYLAQLLARIDADLAHCGIVTPKVWAEVCALSHRVRARESFVDRQLTAQGRAGIGITWFNGLSPAARRYWLDRAQSAAPADAYLAFVLSESGDHQGGLQ